MLISCRRLWLQFHNGPRVLHQTRRLFRTGPDPLTTYSTAELLQAVKSPWRPSSKAIITQDSFKPVNAYRHLRLVDRAALARVTTKERFYLINQAASYKLARAMNDLVKDLLHFCHPAQLVASVQQLVSMPALMLLYPETLLLLLEAIPRHFEKFSVKEITRLADAFTEATPSQVDASIVGILSHELLSRLESLSSPENDDILGYTPPPIVEATFAFIDKLLIISEQSQALQLFQFLVNSANIPSEAVQTMPEVDDFVSIIRASLVRASAYWHWRPLAERILSRLIDQNPTESVIRLTIDTVHVFLIDPREADLQACRILITKVHQVEPVPNVLIQQLYDAATDLDAGSEAYALYSFSRSPEVMEVHEYPCPRGRALPFLMSYLLDYHSHLAKDLGQEILTSNIPLPIEHRAPIVAQLASHGHAILARMLWTKFASGKDRSVFVGDPAMLIRFLSLYQHLFRRGQVILSNQPDNPENEVLREQLEDEQEFSTFVLNEYIRVHQPIQDARHEVLSSLARAYFIVGRYMDGFETFRLLLHRRDMPDLRDVNIILTAVAAHDPREAAKVIERMIQRGLEPNHVTYGTVMHQALAEGDRELANEMVNRIRELKQGHLSPKSIVSLVRGSLTGGRHNQRAKLHSVWRMMQAIDHSTVVTSPHLGKYLVYASLQSESPVLAFQFWEYILKEKALWADLEQKQLRSRLIKSLMRHNKAGWLSVSDRAVRGMIRQLSRRE
ncbi:Golgi reassembly stacking protein 2 [Mycena indigotica]|uniref:Golgi reassembly stacking protein 2 n=1 Tax=Mycena indigotica TaxID=2126181 RepID=A0A8H6SI10_9AGAR|nr:Golgi reassembly stacking protein 2 [Mycena indigotica]KAF7299145.1 Golgi reassembly stacking protein 2 [Mycena indigotica]